MTDNDDSGFTLGYIFELELDEIGKPKRLKVDAQPDEQDAVNSAISAALSSLTTHGSNPVASKGPTFSIALEEYFEKADLKPSTKKTYVSRLHYAKNHFGQDSKVLEIGQLEFTKYAEYVASSIPNVTTQGLYITSGGGFLNWHRIRAGLPQLTTKTLIPGKKTPDTEDREGFTLDQLGVLFLNALRFKTTAPHKYWGTIGVALLGCRLEELAQANLNTDLQHDDEAGIWYLRLDEVPDGDGETRKSIKKPSNWRRIPIHSALVAHGFIDFLHQERTAGASRPFERHCPPYRSKDGKVLKWSHYLGNWGGRELNKLDQQGKLTKGSLTYFHSMRHSFKALMGEAGVSSEISEALAGRRYGGADAERYEKLKTNHRRLYKEGVQPGLTALAALLPNRDD